LKFRPIKIFRIQINYSSNEGNQLTETTSLGSIDSTWRVSHKVSVG